MRFQRQEIIRQIGKEGQKKLAKAQVAIIGAGGLACHVLTELVCLGIGKIVLIDKDTISISNLNRQFLYNKSDIGKFKAEVAKSRFSEYEDVEIIAYNENLCKENISELLKNCSYIVDCVDNIASRCFINEYAIQNKIPLIEGAINGFYGFVMTILPTSACLDCIGYSKTQEQENIPALATVAGVIASLQALECMKLVLGIGKPYTDCMLHFDSLSGEFEKVKIMKSSDCPCCGRE